MNTTAAIFFLILGQADGATGTGSSSGGLAIIPSHYQSIAACEDAGEAFRANNVGLSYASYSCVPAEVNVEAASVCSAPVGLLSRAKPLAEAMPAGELLIRALVKVAKP